MRDKYLTEAMGECWHESSDNYYQCEKCGEYLPAVSMRDWHQTHGNDFSTWEGFGKLIAFLDNEWSDEEIADMLYKIAKDGCVTTLPDKAANYVYDLLTTKA